MKYNTATLYDAVTNESIITEKIENFLREVENYGSQVTLNMVIEVLKKLKNRMDIGQKVMLERNDLQLSEENFKRYIKETYSPFIYNSLFAREQAIPRFRQ